MKHISRRHPDCVRYYADIPDIIADPDYIGKDPTKPDSIEIIKKLDEYVQVAINLDKKDNYLYVASLYCQTQAKVSRRIESGRYVRFI